MRIHSSLPLIAAFVLAAPALAAAQPLTFDRTLDVGASPTLNVSTGSGTVTVQGAPGSRIVVRGVVTVNTGRQVPANAQDLARQLVASPPVAQQGNVVTVGKIADDATRRAVTVSYEISVPSSATVSASSGSGDVAVSGIAGAVKATSGSGNVRASSVDGDVAVKTGSGDVTVRDLKSGAQLSTGSGNIRGAVNGSGHVQASSGSGDIELAGVHGLLSASTASGDIGVAGTPAGDWQLSAASGDVTVDIPTDRGFSIDADTASGDFAFASEVKVQGRVEKRRVQGTVLGGGHTLRLRTASGNIAVR